MQGFPSLLQMQSFGDASYREMSADMEAAGGTVVAAPYTVTVSTAGGGMNTLAADVASTPSRSTGEMRTQHSGSAHTAGATEDSQCSVDGEAGSSRSTSVLRMAAEEAGSVENPAMFNPQMEQLMQGESSGVPQGACVRVLQDRGLPPGQVKVMHELRVEGLGRSGGCSSAEFKRLEKQLNTFGESRFLGRFLILGHEHRRRGGEWILLNCELCFHACVLAIQSSVSSLVHICPYK